MAKIPTWRERLADNNFPEPAPWKSPEECIAAYESGFTGTYPDPEGANEQEDGNAIAGSFGDSGAGELVVLYPEAYKASGRTGWIKGNPSQQVGDCVSHSTRNALMLSLACQVTSGNGSWPTDIPDSSYEKISAFHPTPLYLTRSNAPGHGWSCPTSVSNASKYIGMVVAKDYSSVPGVGVDYSKYSGSQTTKFGRGFPPDDYVKALNGHLVESSKKVSGFENVRSMLKNGFGISTCGGEGWSGSRNEYGYAARKGSWSHALCYYGYDDTSWAHDKFGGPLILIGNSWGPSACKGPTAIHGDKSLGEIPVNCWWARWKDCSSRHCTAISAVAGWPPAKIAPLNLRGLI